MVLRLLSTERLIGWKTRPTKGRSSFSYVYRLEVKLLKTLLAINYRADLVEKHGPKGWGSFSYVYRLKTFFFFLKKKSSCEIEY